MDSERIKALVNLATVYQGEALRSSPNITMTPAVIQEAAQHSADLLALPGYIDGLLARVAALETENATLRAAAEKGPQHPAE